VITEVNSVSVVGKEPQYAQAVFQSCLKSLGKVLLQIDRRTLQIDRPTIGMQLNSEKLLWPKLIGVSCQSYVVCLMTSYQPQMVLSPRTFTR
jgi:hypothetical protein